MEYMIGEKICSLFPHFQRGVVVGRNISNNNQSPELARILAEEAARVSKESNHLADPRLEAWDQAYRSFGANPKKDTPSIRFLVNQIKKGKPPRSINNAVNCFNIISLKYLMPCGGDDLDALSGGDIRLDLAKGKELFAPLFNPEAVESPCVGEVIYFTPLGDRILCRRWNWRNSHFSRVQPQTRNIAINIDALVPPISRATIEEATDELAALIRQYCGGEVVSHILDSTKTSFTV